MSRRAIPSASLRAGSGPVSTGARARDTHGQDASLFYTSGGGRTAVSAEKSHMLFDMRLIHRLFSVRPDPEVMPSREQTASMPQKRHVLISTAQKMCRTMRQDAHATRAPRLGVPLRPNPPPYAAHTHFFLPAGFPLTGVGTIRMIFRQLHDSEW